MTSVKRWEGGSLNLGLFGEEAFENLGIPCLAYSFFHMQVIKIECKWNCSTSGALLSQEHSKYHILIKFSKGYKTMNAWRLGTRIPDCI